MNSLNYLNFLLNHPSLQGTREQAMIKEMMTSGDERVNSIYMGAGQFLTPKLIQDYAKVAAPEVGEYYRQEKERTSKGLDSELEAKKAAYDINVQDLVQQLRDEKRSLDTTEGEKGTWGSSAREERLRSFGNQYNNRFQSLFNTAKQGIEQSALLGENQLGSQINVPEIQGVQADLTQSSPAKTTLSGGYKYNPFGTVGTIQKNKLMSEDLFTKDKLRSAFSNPFKNI